MCVPISCVVVCSSRFCACVVRRKYINLILVSQYRVFFFFGVAVTFNFCLITRVTYSQIVYKYLFIRNYTIYLFTSFTSCYRSLHKMLALQRFAPITFQKKEKHLMEIKVLQFKKWFRFYSRMTWGSGVLRNNFLKFARNWKNLVKPFS